MVSNCIYRWDEDDADADDDVDDDDDDEDDDRSIATKEISIELMASAVLKISFRIGKLKLLPKHFNVFLDPKKRS